MLVAPSAARHIVKGSAVVVIGVGRRGVGGDNRPGGIHAYQRTSILGELRLGVVLRTWSPLASLPEYRSTSFELVKTVHLSDTFPSMEEYGAFDTDLQEKGDDPDEIASA
jgi:hypothetical protein